MQFQDDIYLTVLQAKGKSACWASQLINKDNGGEGSECCETTLMLLVAWIDVMESYYCEHFSDLGNITPDYDCLTLAQAQELLSKIKIIIN